jgi:hypothetical protein
MTRTDVQAWLDRYIEAWRGNRADLIEPLFTEDAVYRYRPYGGDERASIGRDAIVAAWLDEPDEPDSWEAQYATYAVDEDRAVATGISRYLATDQNPERVFYNVFLLRFDPDGRCTDFTEYWMLED